MRVALGNRRLGLRLRQQEEKKEKKTKIGAEIEEEIPRGD